MNNLLQSLKEKCEFHKDTNYLLGVSGGLDSMFLLYAFHQLNLPIEVAHINYQLRGQESDLDALLVEDFCSKNKIPFHLKNINLKEYLEKKGGNLQAIAREVRYSFFNDIQSSYDNSLLVTAHHQDDQMEHFWLMLGRSAGISGLSGMQSNKDGIFRPFLGFSKNEIKLAAESVQLQWREDLSNTKNDYQRNLWRNELLPYLNKEIPSLQKSILVLNQVFSEQLLVDKKIALAVYNKLQKENKISLKEWNQITVNQIIILFKLANINLSHINDIEKIISTQKGKKILFTSSKGPFCALIREDDHLTFVLHNQELVIPEIVIEKEKNLPTQFSKEELWLDASKINGSLFLRPWEIGDRIHPIGIQGSKLISDVLSDAKVPNSEREGQLVLCDAENILACLDLCVSRKAIANAQSEEILKITFK
jgi:tRNA(Ile)-lysidine synthase